MVELSSGRAVALVLGLAVVVVPWIRGSAEAPGPGRSCEDFDDPTRTRGRKGERRRVSERSGFELNWVSLFLAPKKHTNDKDFDPPLESREQPLWFFESLFFCWWYQTTTSEASLNTKQNELHVQVQQLTEECERLKQEESQRQALSLQLQQLQSECKDLRKRQEENESRLKQEESKRQEHESQMQQIQSECKDLRKGQEENESRLKQEESKRQERESQMQQIQSECAKFGMKQDELHMQVQQLTQEREHLKEEESQRQAVTLQLQQLPFECDHLKKRQEESESERLKEESKRQEITLQLQQLQLENEKLKKKEFKFKSLLAAAYSFKSKVEQLHTECEKCDAEDVSQPDSSWEVCTPITEASGISIDTAGRCFMTDAVFKASEVSD